MLDFIKKYKITIIIVVIIALIIGGYFGYRYYINNIGEYNPYSKTTDIEIVNYKTNQYTVINMSEIDVYRAYYKEFMQLLADNPSQAFNMIDDDTKSSLYKKRY